MSLRIDNPFEQGSTAILPKGTVARYRGGMKVYKRETTVTVVLAAPGWVCGADAPDAPIGSVRLPTISWGGSGGYWVDVRVTPELCRYQSARFPVLALPSDVGDFLPPECTPRIGAGYDDRDVLDTVVNLGR